LQFTWAPAGLWIDHSVCEFIIVKHYGSFNIETQVIHIMP
jgi:hypothetical protein